MGQPERAPHPRTSHPSFRWEDALLLEEQLTEDERMIRDAARAYAQEKLLPRVTEAYLTEQPDREIFREMGELGLIGVTFPEEYGCADAGYVSYGLVAREVEHEILAGFEFGFRLRQDIDVDVSVANVAEDDIVERERT